MKLNAKELRTIKSTSREFKKLKKNPIYIILDNVLDTYNIGAIFRLADSVAAEKVILCGQSETPPHTRIKKASINTTEWVSWAYSKTAVSAIKDLRLKIPDLQNWRPRLLLPRDRLHPHDEVASALGEARWRINLDCDGKKKGPAIAGPPSS